MRVYRYGINQPTENELAVREQMRLGHRMKNSLTEVEQIRRDRVSSVTSSDKGVELPEEWFAQTRYPYRTSSSGRYVLRHDGKEVLRGTEHDIWRYIHRHHSYSVEHALRYEGYSVHPLRKKTK